MVAIWDGAAWNEGVTAMCVTTGPAPGMALVPLCLFPTPLPCIVPPERAGEFLAAHPTLTFVCDDAARCHWTLHDFFRGQGDQRGDQALWACSRGHRLLDVSFLFHSLEFSRADGDGSPWPYPRDKRIWPDIGIPSSPTVAMLAARQTAQVYHAVNPEPDHAADGRSKHRRLRARGLHTQFIEVKGYIAAERASANGLRLCPKVRAALAPGLRQSRDAALDEFRSERCRQNYPGTVPGFDRNGMPAFKLNHLDAFLRAAAAELRGPTHAATWPHRGPQHKISTDPEHWGELTRCQRDLATWAGLVRYCRHLRWVESVNDDVVHPNYYLTPRCRSYAPDLELLRQSGIRQLFRPVRGAAFLIVQFPDLALHALAAFCDRHAAGGSRIADVLWQNQDVMTYAADQINWCGRDQQNKQMLTRTLLTVAALRLGPEAAQVHAELECGHRMDLAAAAGYFRQLTTVIFPELAEYERSELREPYESGPKEDPRQNADDALKEVLYAVVEKGYRLAAFTANEIVVEIELLDAVPDAIRELPERVEEAIAGTLDVAWRFRCKTRWSTCW